MRDNKRIAVNTIISYMRLLAIMAISLFSTRYILLGLGETDFGIYNLIAGVVFLFSFIAGTMTTTTQRFVSYTMGKENNLEKVRNVFYNSLVLHFIIALCIAFIVQVGGQLVIKFLLNIPHEKLLDAYFVLITVTIGLVGTILSTPFEAVLMVHENILFVSLCQLFNSIIKFCIAVSVMFIDGERLRLYSMMIAIIPYVQLFAEWFFCHNKYPETRIKIKRISDFSIIKQIGSFAGWVMIGTTCGTVRQQGSSILLNMFFGVAINAANGIAVQVNSVLMNFSNSITTAIRPQLVKNAGSGNMNRMLSLTYIACKYPLILTGLLAVPLIVAMPFVLKLWLKDVPEYSVIFCRLLLLSAIFKQSTMGMTVAMEAYGKVKLLHSVVGLTFLLVIPVGYLLVHYGMPPEAVTWCIVVNEAIASVLRLIFAKLLLNLSIRRYINEVVVRCSIILIISLIVDYIMWNRLSHDLVGLLLFGITTLIVFSGLTYLIGFTDNERQKADRILLKLKNSIIHT